MPEERPAICDKLPPEVIQEAKIELAVAGMGVDGVKPPVAKTADKVGLSISELNSIRAKYKIDIQAIREDLAGIQMGNGYMASKALSQKLQDPVELQALKPKDLAMIAKSTFDSALNLANGQTGAGNTTINIGDIKVLQNLSMEMPELKTGKVVEE